MVKLAALRSCVEGLGFTILPTNDFDRAADLVRATGKPVQSPMFSLDRHEFTRGDAFWVFLMRDGLPVVGMAAKYVDLRDEPFLDYMQRTSRAQYPDFDAPLRSIAQPVKQRVAGRLIYFGELYASDKARGQRKALAFFARFAKLFAVNKWQEFDWMYAFIPIEHRSLMAAYSFSLITESAVTWCDPPPPGRLDNHSMVYDSRQDVLHQLAFQKFDEF